MGVHHLCCLSAMTVFCLSFLLSWSLSLLCRVSIILDTNLLLLITCLQPLVNAYIQSFDLYNHNSYVQIYCGFTRFVQPVAWWWICYRSVIDVAQDKLLKSMWGWGATQLLFRGPQFGLQPPVISSSRVLKTLLWPLSVLLHTYYMHK